MHYAKYCTLILCFLPLSYLGAQCGLTVSAGPDFSVCGLNNTGTLSGSVFGNFTSFQWTPAAGLSNPNSLMPTVSAPGVYTLTATGPSNINLIANGDFEAGAGGFSSDYTLNAIPILDGTYTTVVSPQLVVSTFPPCDDHTFGDGTGQMLLVNGDDTPGENVWCQTIPVDPNTNYDLSAWVSTLVPIGLAQLQFSVNGQLLGAPVSPTATPCEWVPFSASWNSGASTTATVCIVTQSTSGFGNDFVLDDIEMYGECQVMDEVQVEFLPEPVANVQAFRCLGDCFFIGNTPYCGSGNYSQTIPAANGCDSTVNLQLTVLEAIAVVLPPDTLSCYNDFVIELDASPSSVSPFTTYTWSGPNGFSSTLQNPIVSNPGTYTLEITSSAGGTVCSNTASVTVVEQSNQPVADAGPDTTLVCGINEVALNGNASDTGTHVLYTWTGPAGFSSSSLMPTVSDTGTYILEALDTLSGCSSLDSVMVGPGGDSLALSLSADTLSCGEPIAAVTAVADSNAMTFEWSGPNGFADTLLSTSVTTPGWYAFRQTDSTGCSLTDSIFVEADTLLPTFNLSTAELSCNQPTDSLRVTGLAAYDTLLWSGPNGFTGTGESVAITQAGIYQLQVVGTNGCPAQDSVLVTGDFSEPVMATTGAVLDCGDDAATIAASVSGSVSAWSWSGPNSFSASTDTVSVSAVGAYTVSATGPNGCTAMDTVLVQAGQGLPQLSAEGGILTCSNPEVNLSGSATNGASLSWSGPNGFSSPQSNPAVDRPGAYTLTATLGNNCAVDTTVTVMLDTLPPEISAATDTIDCLQATVNLQASSTSVVSDWSWSGPAGFSSSGPVTSTSIAGSYQIRAIGANGCADSIALEVIADTLAPAVQLTADTLSCLQPAANLIADAPAAQDVAWSGPNGFSSLSQNATTTESGMYLLEATAANGCSTLDSIEVVADNERPELTASADTLNCSQTAVTLTANSNLPVAYTWSGPNGFSATEPAPLATEPGDYTVQGAAANGCADTVAVTVAIDTLPPVLQLSADTLTCTDTISTLAAAAPQAQTFSWSGPGNFSANAPSTSTASAGWYTLTATAANGCQTQDSIQVTADQTPPDVSVTADTLSCNQPTATLQATATDAISYQWTGPAGYTSAEAQTDVEIAGPYVLTVMAANGCTASDTVVVVADTLSPGLQLQADTLTCAMPSGTVAATVSDAQVLNWSGPNSFTSTATTFTSSTSGWYTLTATAENGCRTQDSIRLVANQSPPSLQLSADTLTCSTTASTLTAIAPDAATFSWSGPGSFSATAPTATTTAAGWYTLTATAENGCTAQDSIQVVADQAPPSLTVADDTISCATPAVTLQAESPDAISYSWIGPGGYSSAVAQPTVEAAGIYTLTVIAPNGCSRSDSLTVLADTLAPSLELSTDTLSCNQPQAQLTTVVDSPDLAYSWSGPSGFSSTIAEPLVTEAGVYALTVTAPNGCGQTAAVSVAADTVLPLLQATADTLTCSEPVAQLVGSAGGVGGQPLWSGPDGFVQAAAAVDVMRGGAYTFTFTATNGCVDSLQLEVLVDTIAPQLSAEDLALNCRQSTAPLPASVSGSAGLELAWSGPNGFSANVLQPTVDAAGSYQLRAVNPANGCVDSVRLNVTLDTLPPTVSALAADVLDCLVDTVALTGTADAGGAALSFNWSTSEGLFGESPQGANTSAVAPGLYLLAVENLDNGCTAADSVTVEEITAEPEAIDLAVSPPYCEGSTGSARVVAVQGGTPPYLFALGGEAFLSIDTFTQLLPGDYELEVEDANGCRRTQVFTIPQPLPLTIDLPAEVELHFSDALQLEPLLNFPASIVATATWSPADFLSCSDCLRPVLQQPSEGGIYTLTIITTQGCEVSAQFQLKVLKDRDLYLPNAFSPGNDDGRNDFFTVYAAAEEVVRVRRLSIFDRWGGQVFERRDFLPNRPAEGWDGRYRGEAAPAGLYVYWAEVEFVDGQSVLLKGEVLLLR